MTDFLIKSTLSLAAFLGFYHLFLEREKMHVFNRFYLLLSLAISLAIPFITFEIIQEIPVVATPDQNYMFIPNEMPVIHVAEKVNYTPFILVSIYALITIILAFRFGKNIWKLIAKSHKNPSVKLQNAQLVLVEEKTLPHTFLNSIFINYEDYNSRNIEEELYTHELVHVTQKHTLDILFIELLKTVFWFNPLFLFYKKAIQLNHEFLADEKVVQSYNNVPFYQSLLLQKGNGTATIYLASNLNYLVTKKRLIMMTKKTTQKIAMLKKIAIVPILVGLVYFFCIEIVAQEKIIDVNLNAKSAEITDKDKIRDSYYSGVYVKIIDQKTNRKSVTLYEDLSLEDRRKYLNYIPEMMIENEVPQPLFEKMKTKDMAVWINGKVKTKEEISKYKRTDFSYYTYSFVHKNARSKRFPQEYQYTLYTKDYFDENLKNSHTHFKGDTVKIVCANYATAMKNAVAKNIKADTLVWYTEGKEGYNLYINDQEKNKSSNNLEGAIKKDTVKVNKLSDFDTKGKKEGYIYMNNGTYFFIKSNDNTIEYFNRWGIKVDENGKPIDKKAPQKRSPGTFTINGETFFYSYNEDGTKEYYNRLGFKVDENGKRINSQNPNIDIAANTKNPEFPGGISKFFEFVFKNYKIPEEAKKNKINGTLYLSFIVEEDGSLSEIKVLKDLKFGTGDEAVRVLKNSPKWSPGEIDGNKTRMQQSLPLKIHF